MRAIRSNIIAGICLFSALALLVLGAAHVIAQAPAASQPSPTPAAEPRDTLGRSTPRGTVVGFLTNARKGENGVATLYLDTTLSGAEAETLARELFVVLDARLPARLLEISDAPDGSRANPLAPDREVVATIARDGGTVDIVLDRVTRPSGRVWLFSSTTLDIVPDLYAEIAENGSSTFVGRLLSAARLRGIRLFDWLTVLIVIGIAYFAVALINRLLTPVLTSTWRRTFGETTLTPREALPMPVRLLLLVFIARWGLAGLPLSLLVRQIATHTGRLLTVAAVAWLLMFVIARAEEYVRGRFPKANTVAAASLLRVLRRLGDALVIFAAVIATLRLFDIDPTPALAGLGVGGIAVALAAQKTLENMIAGASLVFDQAVRVGDVIKVDQISGTVDHIGLRSTRIRTPNRTVVSIPNSQIANASVETLSARDKFLFNHAVGLSYRTTPAQLNLVVHRLRHTLSETASVERDSVRVRLLRLGAFSLDVDVFAYVFARDWNHFLEIQEQLLFAVTSIVEDAGTEIAFPTQTMHIAGDQPKTPDRQSSLPTSGS